MADCSAQQVQDLETSSDYGDPVKKSTLRLLLTVVSFKGGEELPRCRFVKGGGEGELPKFTSIGFTIGFIFCVLWMVEHMLRRIFLSIQHLYPLLGDETKQNILARSIGVNMLGTFTVACLGWKSRHVLEQVWNATVQVLWKRRMTAESRTQMNKIEVVPSLTKAYETRLFKYHPEAAHIAVFFISYQCKNLVDSIIWKDSPLLIVHHILCIFSIGGGLLFGIGQFYAIFCCGISELSTAILVVLVMFDSDQTSKWGGQGVSGLGDAFPLVRTVLGPIFALSYFMIRIVFWGILTYYYFQDIWQAFQDNHTELNYSRRIFLYLNSLTLGFLTLLQIIWLFEIFKILFE